MSIEGGTRSRKGWRGHCGLENKKGRWFYEWLCYHVKFPYALKSL